MAEEVPAQQPWRARAAEWLDRVESIYLRILRAFILIFATGLILYAAVLAVTSLIKISRSPDSVVEEVATVNGQDLLAAEGAEVPRPDRGAEADRTNPAHRRFYQNFVRRYHAVFRERFEPFRQREDRRLALDAFDDAYIDTEARLAATTDHRLDFDSDRADLERLLAAMSEAAQRPETRRRLQSYRTARKVRACRNVQRTRTVQRSGWDRYSTACPDWFYPPYGCPVQRAVQQPYTERVCEMRFPEGTRSHADIFRAYHDRFFSLLDERRQSNVERAALQRRDIMIGNAEGSVSLESAKWHLGAFLVLMFFFLFVAVERHQRRLAAIVAVREEGAVPGATEEAKPEPAPAQSE
jgi:hypothetical protein